MGVKIACLSRVSHCWSCIDGCAEGQKEDQKKCVHHDFRRCPLYCLSLRCRVWGSRRRRYPTKELRYHRYWGFGVGAAFHDYDAHDPVNSGVTNVRTLTLVLSASDNGCPGVWLWGRKEYPSTSCFPLNGTYADAFAHSLPHRERQGSHDDNRTRRARLVSPRRTGVLRSGSTHQWPNHTQPAHQLRRN